MCVFVKALFPFRRTPSRHTFIFQSCCSDFVSCFILEFRFYGIRPFSSFETIMTRHGICFFKFLNERMSENCSEWSSKGPTIRFCGIIAVYPTIWPLDQGIHVYGLLPFYVTACRFAQHPVGQKQVCVFLRMFTKPLPLQ